MMDVGPEFSVALLPTDTKQPPKVKTWVAEPQSVTVPSQCTPSRASGDMNRSSLRMTACPTACWASSVALWHLHTGFSQQRCPRAQGQSLSLPYRSLPSPTLRHPQSKGRQPKACSDTGLDSARPFSPVLQIAPHTQCTHGASRSPSAPAPSDAHCDTHPRITAQQEPPHLSAAAGAAPMKSNTVPSPATFPLQKHLGRAHGLPFGAKRKNTVKRGYNLSMDGMNQQKQERVWLQKTPSRPPGRQGRWQPVPAAQQLGSSPSFCRYFPTHLLPPSACRASSNPSTRSMLQGRLQPHQ